MFQPAYILVRAQTAGFDVVLNRQTVVRIVALIDHQLPRFVKQYADLNSVLTSAVNSYIEDVENGTFPCTEHEFD